MVIELTEQERLAVSKGTPLRLDTQSDGALVVLRESDYIELLSETRESEVWVTASTNALNRWCKENPF